MNACQVSLAIIIKTQNCFCRNNGRRSAAGQSNPLPPVPALTIARARNVRHTLGQALLVMIQQHDKSLRQTRDITGSARTRQSDQTFRSAYLRRIQISVAIDLGGSQKAQVHASRLQQAHHAQHVQALRGPQYVGRIGHGVNKFGSGSSADYTVLKQSNCVRSMGPLGNDKGNQRKAHAHKHNFAVADFARRTRHHELAHGIAHLAPVLFR